MTPVERALDAAKIEQAIRRAAGLTSTASPSRSVGQRWVNSPAYLRARATRGFEPMGSIADDLRSMESLLRADELVGALRLRTYTDATMFSIDGTPQISTLPVPARVPQLCETIIVTKAQVELAPEASEVHGATSVAEGTAFSESGVTFSAAPTLTRLPRWGTTFPVTLQFLDDPGPAGALLDSRLRLDFPLGLEVDMLIGDGTGTHFTGVLHAAGTNAVVKGDTGHTTEYRLDAIARAIAVTHDQGWYTAPLVCVAHPDTLLAIRGERDGGGRYVWNPAPVVDIEAWVPSTSMPTGTAIVANWFDGAALFIKDGISVDTSREHSDFFTKAMALMMLWTRAWFWVRRPECFTMITGL